MSVRVHNCNCGSVVFPHQMGSTGCFHVASMRQAERVLTAAEREAKWRALAERALEDLRHIKNGMERPEVELCLPLVGLREYVRDRISDIRREPEASK